MKTTSKLTTSLLVFTCLMMPCDQSHGSEQTVRLSVGGTTLIIPKNYTLEKDSLSYFFSSITKLDNPSRDILLMITSEEIKREIPEYVEYDGGYKEDLDVRLTILNVEEISAYTQMSMEREAWTGKGSYEDRIIDQVGSTNHYRVFRRIEFPIIWMYFSSDPNLHGDSDVKPYFIGYCQNIGSSLTISGERASCRSRFTYDDILIEYRLSDVNIALTSEIKSFLIDRVASWKNIPK